MWMAAVGTSGENLQRSDLTFDLSWSNLQERNLDLMSEQTFNPRITLFWVIKQYSAMVNKKEPWLAQFWENLYFNLLY